MQLVSTLQFIVNHPLNRKNPLAALRRYANWQLSSRLHDEIEFKWIDDAVLAVKHGMTGATGNIYCGLHEFVEMAFLLHLLRPDDLFLDIGANIGSYTVLASKVCGSRSLAFEPDPMTAKTLRRNVELNALENLVTVNQVALGAKTGEVAFTAGLDTVNRVATLDDRNVQTVPIKRLEDISGTIGATFAKLDVEGFEEQVLLGATKVLSSPSLLAVQSETCDASVNRILSSFGFERMYYEPYTREISDKPFSHRILNGLFARNAQDVVQRVMRAPRRKIFENLI